MKTNAVRLLDVNKIPYEMVSYKINKDNYDAEQIALDNNIPQHLLYKTLICIGGDKEIIVAVLPANEQLSIKKLEKVAGIKQINLLPTEELMVKIGYIRGGCSPIAMKKKFPVYIQSSKDANTIVWINAGKKGVLLKMLLDDIIMITEGQLADISR
ncbi:MAG: aminoacyl-tRNA deacylase [Saprospiraceae bacterium]|jgi:Cys-tRNA(Pro)/Cys-tRNA(Cys) deacylase|nr:aminoacyl-tRNA deacylase [Saprospiraceae bacterium]MDP4698940.1 aminoacyl-tRNA deacylase [Saprospiraceae bacterium]MDP4813526.1 aminoacyl-tRNA deacylase [Saprospiraceae bacterium]MDP4851972.1 aminoacyl-tRNA deacylase [Saprospiraceae bacterium]MDP4915436.1 aminoacyl-tRNA deacylase [Saprospiraceae bacterium]